jgi:hypothetical protein
MLCVGSIVIIPVVFVVIVVVIAVVGGGGGGTAATVVAVSVVRLRLICGITSWRQHVVPRCQALALTFRRRAR